MNRSDNTNLPGSSEESRGVDAEEKREDERIWQTILLSLLYTLLRGGALVLLIGALPLAILGTCAIYLAEGPIPEEAEDLWKLWSIALLGVPLFWISNRVEDPGDRLSSSSPND